MALIDWSKVPPPRTLLPRRRSDMPLTPKMHTRRSLLERIDRLRTNIVDAFRDNEVAITRGLGRCEPEMEDLAQEAIASLQSSRPPRLLRVRVEAATAVFTRAAEGTPVVPYWVACNGLGFAVAATCRWARLELVEDDDSGEAIAWLARRAYPVFEPAHYSPCSRLGPWSDLRAAVAVADHETYFEALRVASRLRDHVALPVRCGLSFAFSSEERWAEEDAEEALHRLPADPTAPVPHHLLALLASLRWAPHIEGVVEAAVERGCGPLAADYAWELVATLGEHAAPALESLGHEAALDRIREALRPKKESAA